MQRLREVSCTILQMIEEILRLSESPIDTPALADLRKRVALAQSEFFAAQEQLALQPLRQSGDPALAEIARCCVERDLEGRQMGLVHYQRWPLARILEDPEGYRADLRQMLRWMEARTRYGNDIVYPAVARLISSSKRPTLR